MHRKKRSPKHTTSFSWKMTPWVSFLLAPILLSGCLATTGTGDRAAGQAAVQATTPAQAALDPDYRALLLAHGARALEGGTYEEATSAYKRVLDAEPNNPDALYGIAETLLVSGNHGGALGYYRKLSGNEDFRARALQGEGIALLVLGDHFGSIESLKLAVANDVTLWRAWNALGRALDIQGKRDEARGYYDRALALNPDSTSVLNNRGVSHLLAGRYLEAEKDLRRAHALDRELERAQANLRIALAWQGRYAEALAGVSRINAPVTLNNIGYIAMNRGDLNHAEAYFAQAMQMSPAFYDKADRNLKFLQELKKLETIANRQKG